MKSAKRRGWCPVCRYYWPLRKDGKLMRHHVITNFVRSLCAGAGSQPVPSLRIDHLFLVDAYRLRATFDGKDAPAASQAPALDAEPLDAKEVVPSE